MPKSASERKAETTATPTYPRIHQHASWDEAVERSRGTSRRGSDPDLQAMVMQIFQALALEQGQHWVEGRTTRPFGGFTYPKKEEQTGSFGFEGIDVHGRRMRGTASYVDSQAELEPSGITPPDAAGETNRRVLVATSAERPCDQIVLDGNTAIGDRVVALNEWVQRDNDAAARYVLDELARPALDSEWFKAVVFASEDVRLRSSSDQLRLGNLLKGHALELRQTSAPGVDEVVWSAVRRFGSLVPAANAWELLDFLTARGYVDTRLVALQAIVRIFEVTPPVDTAPLSSLANRVHDFAVAFLNPDVFTAGETSAIAEEAVHALAALGDDRLADCVRRVQCLGRDWFDRQVKADLENLLHGWAEHDNHLELHPAFIVVRATLRGWN